MRERIDRKARKASYHFDSLAEIASYVRDTPRTWRCSDSERGHASSAWDLNLGYDGAVDYAANGWNEGARKVQDTLKTLPLKARKPDVKTDFYGHMAHVPRYCAGAPDSMIRHERQGRDGSGAVATVYVPINALGSVGAGSMRNFGLAVAHYINQLEQQGTRVELYGAQCSTVAQGAWRVAHTWKLKRAEQPLDLAVIAFALGHPAMFRRIGFALRERCAAPTDSGYGQSVALTLEDIIDAPAGAIILNGMRNADMTSGTPEKALKTVGEQIDKVFENDEAE